MSALMLSTHGVRDKTGTTLFDGLATIRRINAKLVLESANLKICRLEDTLILQRGGH